MSVFKRAGSEVYSYDFRCRGRRFSGTTDCTTKRAAEAFERQVKDEAKRDQLDTSKPLTFQAAAFIYWNEVGQHHSDPSGPERNIAWLQAEIGANTLLSDITNATVARLVAKRRGEDVANATVNRSVVEPLRTILRRAAKMNGAKIQSIDWSAHRLKEPEERVREANANEQAAVLAAMREDYRPLITFAIMTGCRRAEIVGLTWQDVNWFAREFRVKGKGDYSRTIPMTDALHELLFSLKDHHKTAVFTFVAARTRNGRTKGKRYPVTDEGFNTFWQRYGKKAVTDFRFHDTRHTAATRLVRRTGNLKMVQRLLGHKNIETTARYAHVTHDDLRNGLEAVDAATNATKNATKKRKRSSKDMI